MTSDDPLKIDFKYKLFPQTDETGRVTFRLEVTVCNRTHQTITGGVVENPIAKDRTKIRIRKDDAGNPIKGSDRAAARKDFRRVVLAPKGQDGECATFAFVFDVEPGASYTDVYEFEADGKTLKQEKLDGTVETLKIEKASNVPPETERFLALALPLPFPMALDGIYEGPISIGIDEVLGLPPGFEVARVFPGPRESLMLGFADRASGAVVLLRQRASLPEGARHKVTFLMRIREPASLIDRPAGRVTIDLANDTTPPQIELSAARRDKKSIVVRARFSDACSGLDVMELASLGRDGKAWCVTPGDAIRTQATFSSGFNRATVRFWLDSGIVKTAKALVLRATDSVGNEAVLDVRKAILRMLRASR